ncbi:hypothetical protein N658DRAFT_495795 [Parathielavia hyrcaniae]|uniref:Protamine P1 n=1 Tax=Parathielavia hyrcaniae TaxID=113614 RepID=A0AAN6T201_9PEZI|nr:hypothetical protein N658DRAFT_495795 [Parathielavia hyrcaniae]
MKRRYGSPDLEWLHPENFCDEPIYCEAPPDSDGVLYSGSDDDEYNSPSERRLRYETQARRFLKGKPVFLLSASLRGPFDRKSGWVNPWRSKSASRAKRVQKNRAPAAKKAQVAEKCETSGIFESSSIIHHDVPESSAALPGNASSYIPPPYMDGESFHRVWDWRDRVVAESETPTSPSQRASRTEPTSADSRRATQQTAWRRSGFTLDTMGDRPKCLAPNTPSVQADAEQWGASGLPKQDTPKATPSLPARTRLGSDQPPFSQRCRGEISTTTNGPPVHTAKLSPHAVRSNEPFVPSTGKARSTPLNQAASQEETAAKGFAERKVGRNASLQERITTPNSAILKGATSSALQRTQPSPRTDGSFRYRRRDAQEKGASLGRSKLAGPPSKHTERPEEQHPANRTSPGPAVEELEVTAAATAMPSPEDVLAARREAALPVDEAAACVREQKQPEATAVPGHSRSSQQSKEEAAEWDGNAGDGAAETTSQIDGPTLIPLDSQSGSGRSTMPSFGHFSCEKHSQDTLAETTGLTRRLLWPKGRSTSGDPLPMSGPGATATPESNMELDRCSASASLPDVPKDASAQPAEIVKAVQASQGECRPYIEEDSCGSMHEGAAEELEPMAEIADESEIASEAEDEDVGTNQVPTEAEAGSGFASDAKTIAQQVSSPPASEPQSPWIQGDRPHPTSGGTESHESQRNTTVQATRNKPTPAKATQSPWAKEIDVERGVSDTPQLRDSDNARLSFIASQALGQAASQSPWARGDPQLQPPEVRVFNPLSSPANSHVLPTADPTTHSPAHPAEDIDTCSSHLCPPQPSTPKTKRSGLPSPDFTLSVKSFKDFMTPSPQPPAKRRRISATADDRLPSTQALIDAAVSNPWTRPSTTKPKKKKQKQPRPRKRVSWAPLPDDELNISSPGLDTTTHEHIQAAPSPHSRQRAASPPPSILSLSDFTTTDKLPGANQKFAKHFAAVASRRRVGGAITTTATPMPLQKRDVNNSNSNNHGINSSNSNNGSNRTAGGKRKGEKQKGPAAAAAATKRRLLPSASQQVCGSPAVGGMAEAFLRADATTLVSAAAAAATGVASGAGLVTVDWGRAGLSSALDGCGDMLRMDGDGEGNECVKVDERGQDAVVNFGSDLALGVDVADYHRHGNALSHDDDEEEDEDEEMTQERMDGEEEVPVDEVSAVMENLDDFLGGNWDLEADLAKARAGTEREGRVLSSSEGVVGMAGLMDVGVWN